MTKDELFDLLRYCGKDLSKFILMLNNESLRCINEGMGGRLAEYVNKDPQGLTQCGSMLGNMRPVNVDKALSDMGFESDIFGAVPRCDIVLEGFDCESRGAIAHIGGDYGLPRGGGYSLEHDKRIYFVMRDKIDIDLCKLVSMLFQILYIDSSKFEKPMSGKVNITQLKKICREDVIGEWEIFNGEVGQAHFTCG